MSSQSGALQAGIDALKQGRYSEAINLLETFCRNHSFSESKELLQAQMWLVKAYPRVGQPEKAIALCQQLSLHENPQVHTWAKQTLQTLSTATPAQPTKPTPRTAASETQPTPTGKLNRAAKAGAKLAMSGIGGSLALASGVTISLLFGMVFVLALSLVFILGSDQPGVGFGIAVGFTLVFNAIAFFISPWFMDLIQGWFYGTRWVSLPEVARYSPEAARVIQQVCAQKKLKQPRLGIINDENPTAFTYGSLPNSARLVVSQGLFTYLDDEEAATVYAHELGHIVHWDFAVMTVAATLVQITYLIYSFARRMSRGGGDNKLKDAMGTAAIAAYIFYLIGTYLVLYLSRTREYFADHFAAETTGNPNALSRALVKIAYGILEEGQRAKEPSKLIEGTRALGIYDPKAASSVGTAYRVASSPEKVGRVFLWDMFNPWGWLMELSSTHPLTGKRVRALSTYAEQLGLETEFDMARVVAESRTLNKSKLYGNFALDLLLYGAEFIGLAVGLLIGLALMSLAGWKVLVSLSLLGLGLGILVKMMVTFPDFSRAQATDVLSLMSDPYASPLRGRPVKLSGELIGRGDAGYKFGSDLKLQDPTGMMYVHYASRFGPFGNLMFGANQVQGLLGSQVNATGWFRRSIMPWVDLAQLKTVGGKTVDSYHRFWQCILGAGAIIAAIVVPVVF
uniref:M48 family metalloprotease n=1 Tax=Trichocoleus desertorum TaxID=1481672 RepID=UPI0025B5B5EA|nr:M48 family metalloprotease [Trichocoleus desertorum]